MLLLRAVVLVTLAAAAPISAQGGVCVSGSCSTTCPGSGTWRYADGAEFAGTRVPIESDPNRIEETVTCVWGRGTVRYANGETFEGEWSTNDRAIYHGLRSRGTYTWPGGQVCEGTFNFSPTTTPFDVTGFNEGTCRFPDGATFTGRYQNVGAQTRSGTIEPSPQATGTYRFPGGATYAGALRRQSGGGQVVLHRHGEGTYTWPAGHSWRGTWADDRPVQGGWFDAAGTPLPDRGLPPATIRRPRPGPARRARPTRASPPTSRPRWRRPAPPTPPRSPRPPPPPTGASPSRPTTWP